MAITFILLGSVISSTTILGGLVFALLCVIVYLVLSPKQGQTKDVGADAAMAVAFQAHGEGLGFLKNLFLAIAARDRQKVDEQISYLAQLMKDGTTFSSMLEQFVYAQVKLYLSDKDKKAKLLGFIATVTGQGVQLIPPPPPAAS